MKAGAKLTLLSPKGGYDPAEGIPRYGIEHDIKFFDIPSLIRMYGEKEVREHLQSRHGLRLIIREKRQ